MLTNKIDKDNNIALSLKESLESTSKGLALFAHSLKSSGFEEALPKYRQLQAVLIQQRLWCQNKGREELVPIWQDIAKKSSQIFRIISPMAEMMRQLMKIDTLTLERNQNPLQMKILKILSNPQFISLHRLSKILDYEKKRIASELNHLIERGRVESRGWGNGQSFRLKTEL